MRDKDDWPFAYAEAGEFLEDVSRPLEHVHLFVGPFLE